MRNISTMFFSQIPSFRSLCYFLMLSVCFLSTKFLRLFLLRQTIYSHADLFSRKTSWYSKNTSLSRENLWTEIRCLEISKNMQNITQCMSTINGINWKMTSMQNFQTYSIFDLNLFASMIVFAHNETIQVIGDMISGVCIVVPIWINLVGGSSHQCCRRRFFLIGLIHYIPATNDNSPTLPQIWQEERA